MINQENRFEIIEECLIKKLSLYEANKVLQQHGQKTFDEGESDCYKVLISGTHAYSNPRQKIIASSLMRGLSKIEANLQLYDAKFRRLSVDESCEYDDILSRIRYCGKSFQKAEVNLQTKQKISKEDIINSGIIEELSVELVNKKLVENGYNEMSNEEIAKYRFDYNSFHNKRQGIIQHAYQELKSVQEVNIILKENNLSTLSMVEEMNYLKQRETIEFHNRENFIKECIEEKLEIFEINILLNKNSYEKLSEQEEEKIRSEINTLPSKRRKRKTTELSNQFRKLYREATKDFHPDRFNTKEDKEKANTIMKQLNEAKDKNDYFRLKEIVEKNKNTFTSK